MSILRALGLVIPGILRTHLELTPLAAGGLTIIMIGAVTTTIATASVSMAILPFIVGILTVTVARGRRSYLQFRPAPPISPFPHHAARGR